MEAYSKAQGLFRTDATPDPLFSETLELDMGEVEPAMAGPKRPQDRINLREAHTAFETSFAEMSDPANRDRSVTIDGYDLKHGSVVIAAITSCTNTSNPEVMLGAGLLARKAVELGLKTHPWVKTSLAPG